MIKLKHDLIHLIHVFAYKCILKCKHTVCIFIGSQWMKQSIKEQGHTGMNLKVMFIVLFN